jgi:hypothetical protein
VMMEKLRNAINAWESVVKIRVATALFGIPFPKQSPQDQGAFFDAAADLLRSFSAFPSRYDNKVVCE